MSGDVKVGDRFRSRDRREDRVVTVVECDGHFAIVKSVRRSRIRITTLLQRYRREAA